MGACRNGTLSVRPKVHTSGMMLNSPGVYAGIILVLAMTGMHEVALRRLERTVAAYRES